MIPARLPVAALALLCTVAGAGLAPASAVNPCEAANPPAGCPPLHPHPHPAPPAHPLPWRVASFDPELGDPAHGISYRHPFLPALSASFAAVHLDAESASTIGDIGTVASGYSGRIACKNRGYKRHNGVWIEDPASLSEDGALSTTAATAIVTAGPGGEKVLTVPPLLVTLAPYDTFTDPLPRHVAKICFARLITPEHRAATIESWRPTEIGGQWSFDFRVAVTRTW